MKYLLDTHAWIWWNSRPKALSAKVRKLLSNRGGRDEFLLSAMSVWEFCRLVEEGKAGLSCPVEEWVETALDEPGLRLVPLTPRIAHGSTALPGAPPPDPVDRVLAATAREEDATILTQDSRLSDYRHVRTFW